MRKRALNIPEDGSEEEEEPKKERTKRGKFLSVKEEKDSNEVVVEVRVCWFPQQKVSVSCL